MSALAADGATLKPFDIYLAAINDVARLAGLGHDAALQHLLGSLSGPANLGQRQFADGGQPFPKPLVAGRWRKRREARADKKIAILAMNLDRARPLNARSKQCVDMEAA